MANCRDLAFKFDELNKVYLLLGTVLLCWSLNCCLSEISEFYFYLDNENEEFIINEGIFNKTKQLFSWIESNK
jgi:putative membrane protein